MHQASPRKERIHPTSVTGFNGTLEELAQAILRMRYDKVAEFFEHCEKELTRQKEGDLARGRYQLGCLLRDARVLCMKLKKQFIRISNVCKPYMRKELQTHKKEK